MLDVDVGDGMVADGAISGVNCERGVDEIARRL
jgi:hypothetical protein